MTEDFPVSLLETFLADERPVSLQISLLQRLDAENFKAVMKTAYLESSNSSSYFTDRMVKNLLEMTPSYNPEAILL